MLVAAGAAGRASLVAATAPHPASIVAINRIVVASMNLMICILSSLDQISALTLLYGDASLVLSVFCLDVTLPIKFPIGISAPPLVADSC
jgi:hypothetical protein